MCPGGINMSKLSFAVVSLFKSLFGRSGEQKRKTGFPRMIQIAGSKKWWLFSSMGLSVIAAGLQFFPVIVVYMIIVELAAHAANIELINRGYLVNLGYLSLASVGLFGIFTYASYMLSHVAAFNILYEIRVNIAEKLTKLSLGYFCRKSSGQIKKVMSDDVERIELFVAHHIPDITSAVLFPVIMIGYLFYSDWRLAIAAIIPLPLAVGVHMKMMMSSTDVYKKYHDSLEKMNTSVVEYVRGMPVVKVFNASSDSFSKLKETVFSYRDFTHKITEEYSIIYPAFLTALSSSLFFIIPVAVFLLSGMNTSSELIPTVFLFLIVGGGMFFPFLKLMFVSGFLRQIAVSIERIDEILYQEELPDGTAERTPADSSIEFEEVTFSYDDVPVLKKVSFRAEPNTVTALVGPSGAGKSTIGHLTARFWDADSGTIRVGGVDISEIRNDILMEHISFVFQESFLFFDTIEENIRMGNNTASREEVIEAAKAANCHEFIEKLPGGYSTLVGEGGTYLSGGEQQRIAIARAILKNTPIVLLDEATAFADPENEGKILTAIAHLVKNKTLIVIAHRLSTITDAHQILVVDGGRIVERGTHQQLAVSGGLYQSMWETYSRSRQWTVDYKVDYKRRTANENIVTDERCNTGQYEGIKTDDGPDDPGICLPGGPVWNSPDGDMGIVQSASDTGNAT
jgi:ATP-binding cassette, subfamily B, bacterial IrtA/YbtP